MIWLFCEKKENLINSNLVQNIGIREFKETEDGNNFGVVAWIDKEIYYIIKRFNAKEEAIKYIDGLSYKITL